MYRLLVFSGLAQAATVFLSPSDALPSRLSPQQANLVLASHLGLEQFVVVDQSGRLNHLFEERDFVGQGDQSALLLLLDQAYARDVVPPTLEPSFSFSESPSAPLSSFLETCAQRALHAYTYVANGPTTPSRGVPRALDAFSAPTPANDAFLADVSTLVEYLDAPPSDRFAALELTSVPKLAQSYGQTSQEYTLAVETLRTVVDAALADGSVRLALITYSPNAKRSTVLGQESSSVVMASTGCFGSLEACTDGTNDCSGHGECTNATRAGQTCFVCACTKTMSESGKAQTWAGQMCERRDVSGPFVLIAGTVVTLILLIGGAVSLLYAIDGHELPSILLGGVAGGGVRRE